MWNVSNKTELILGNLFCHLKIISIIFCFSIFCVQGHAKKIIIKIKNTQEQKRTLMGKLERMSNTVSLNKKLRKMNGVKSKALVRLGYVLVDSNDKEMIANLKNNPSVQYVEEEIKWKTQSETNPASLSSAPWLEDTQGLDTVNPAVNALSSGNRVKVAVIDTGVMTNHNYLNSIISVNTAEANGIAGVDDDGNGYVDDIHGGNSVSKDGEIGPIDDHGTHVSGLVKIIRDQALADGRFPEASGVEILPIRFFDDEGFGSTFHAIEALEYAASQGVKVINASWGAKGIDSYSQALYDAFKDLYQTHDIVFTVASGNADFDGANNNDQVPFFPSSFNIPSLISVASITPEYNVLNNLIASDISDFSNFGAQSVSVAAPGDYIDSMGNHDGVISASYGVDSSGNLTTDYVGKQGTSMAAPVVAGIAAVIRAINPSLTSYEVTQVIYQSAQSNNDLLGKVSTGAQVHAEQAFLLAQNTVSQGLNPAVDSSRVIRGFQGTQPVSSASQSSSGGSSSGCGAIHSGSSNSFNDLLAGNSLLLLMSLYLLFLSVRKRKFLGV